MLYYRGLLALAQLLNIDGKTQDTHPIDLATNVLVDLQVRATLERVIDTEPT